MDVVMTCDVDQIVRRPEPDYFPERKKSCKIFVEHPPGRKGGGGPSKQIMGGKGTEISVDICACLRS